MSSFKERFNFLLKEEASEQMRPEKRPSYDSEEDIREFDKGVDPDVDPKGYDIEGLGSEISSVVDDTTTQVIEWADEIESFTKRLLDPENPDALLTKLTSVTNIPEYASAAESVAKHLRKAVSEIGAAKTELDVLASMASARRNARREADNASSGASGPY